MSKTRARVAHLAFLRSAESGAKGRLVRGKNKESNHSQYDLWAFYTLTCFYTIAILSLTHTRHFYPRFFFIDMCTYTTHLTAHTATTTPQKDTPQTQTDTHAYIPWRSHTKEPSYERSLDYFCYK